MYEVEIYTDGACSGNPGPGGWGVVLSCAGREKELSGGENYTTNQRMEIKAAIEGLRALRMPCQVRLYSDSAYLIRAFQDRWLEGWQRNGWRTKNKGEVKNKELWQELLEVASPHKITWIKVKGHSDNEGNNRADALAREGLQKKAGR
jgi:ribonuclease HI